MRRRLPAAGAAVALLLVASCGGSSSDPADAASPTTASASASASADSAAPGTPATDDAKQFVAAVAGSTFKLGIVVTDESTWAYLCNEEGRSLGLSGSLTDGTLSLADSTGESTDTELTGKLSSEGFIGTLTLDGRTVDIDAKPAVGNQGVHWRTTVEGDTRTVSSWVVAPSGFAGSKATVQTTQTADGEQIQVSQSPEGPPPNGDPQPTGLFKCIRATRALFRANEELAQNPSMGAAANQANAAREQNIACNPPGTFTN